MSRQTSLLVELSAAIPSSTPASDALAVGVFADDPRLPAAETLGGELRALCERVTSFGEFKGEEETSLLIHAAIADGKTTEASGADVDRSGDESGVEPTGTLSAARRVLLVGLGSHADCDDASLRRAGAVAVRAARSARARSLQFVVPQPQSGDHTREAVRALAEGAHLGCYENGFYRKKEADDEPRLERLTFVGAGESGELREELERARIVAESANWTRSLADEPGLSLPPREFARRAAEMAAEFGLKVESLDAEGIRARGMGGLLGVGQGSDEEPALIVLRYEPEGAAEDDELWAFVGKGITFDTGGISIKHGLDMYEMKTDMAGGAAALGALRAIAQLKARRRVVAVVPAAENMPSGKAIKPGDIVRTLAGYTIECVDTDAEGRLVLVDGIAYAKHLGASRIVDLATLTGSIIVALGSHRTGLFSNNDEWANRVLAAARSAGEPAWRMPVSDDYKKKIESPIADFKNYG
ncbi:MAG: leucyl aminopeptidase, partial [Acidobacteriota bacterium]|nr:leucyl aminopeptidase [Acidobacteriota bacterium]